MLSYFQEIYQTIDINFKQRSFNHISIDILSENYGKNVKESYN
jgi:hypothetical protein